MSTIDLVNYYNETKGFWENVTECVMFMKQELILLKSSVDAENGSFTGYVNVDGSSAAALTAALDLDMIDEQSLTDQAELACLKELVGSTPYVTSWISQLIWTLLFGAMVSVATIGNSIVIWIILCHRRMRTVTNYFLLNLAIADLMMATFNAGFNFIFMLNSHWPFGSIYCTMNNFIAHLSVFSSVFTLTAMSLDRYVAIVRPLRPRMSRKTGTYIIMFIWAIGIVLSLPILIYSTTITYKYPDGGIRTVCFLQWPDGVSGVSKIDYIYNLAFLIVSYAVPVSCMLLTYPSMAWVLWRSKTIGEINERQKFAVKSKKRVVRMLVVVVIIFILCWAPYHIYFILTYHFPDFVHTQYVQHIYLAIYFTAMSNSVYNPITYYCMNGSFRCYFNKVLCCCCINTQLQRLQTGWPAPMAGEGERMIPASISMTTFQRQKSFPTSLTTTALNSNKNACVIVPDGHVKRGVTVEKEFCSL